MLTLWQFVFNGLVVGGLVGTAALGITAIFGVWRFANVAQGDFMTFGAYIAWVLNIAGLGLWWAGALAVLTTMALGGALAFGVFRPLARQGPIRLLVASIGVSLFVRYGVAAIFGSAVQSYNVPLTRDWNLWGQVLVSPVDMVILAVVTTAMVAYYLLLFHTRLGVRMRAAAEVPDLARVIGVSVERVALFTFVIAAGLAGIGGVLLGLFSVLTPDMGWELVISAFSAAILGGIGNPFGAVAGAMLVGVTEQVAVFWVPDQYTVAVGFAILILTLILRPQGLFGVTQRA